jgi:hypothetical protein
MPLAVGIEFFLDDEAHHLYTVLRRVREGLTGQQAAVFRSLGDFTMHNFGACT